MMPRYIDADELKEWVENWLYKDRYYHNGRVSKTIPTNELYDILEQIPTTDVVERKTGKWEQKEDPYGFFDTIPVCSVCGHTTKMRETYAYCPNCGAEMEVSE